MRYQQYFMDHLLNILLFARKASATGCNPNMNESYTKLTSIFGGKLAPAANTFRSQIGFLGQEPERPEKKKEEDRGVPTHWLAEHHDRAAVSENC